MISDTFNLVTLLVLFNRDRNFPGISANAFKTSQHAVKILAAARSRRKIPGRGAAPNYVLR